MRNAYFQPDWLCGVLVVPNQDRDVLVLRFVKVLFMVHYGGGGTSTDENIKRCYCRASFSIHSSFSVAVFDRIAELFAHQR